MNDEPLLERQAPASGSLPEPGAALPAHPAQGDPSHTDSLHADALDAEALHAETLHAEAPDADAVDVVSQHGPSPDDQPLRGHEPFHGHQPFHGESSAPDGRGPASFEAEAPAPAATTTALPLSDRAALPLSDRAALPLTDGAAPAPSEGAPPPPARRTRRGGRPSGEHEASSGTARVAASTLSPLARERARVVGQTWAAELRQAIVLDNRRASGGWPGTLGEARMHVAVALLPWLQRQGQPLSMAQQSEDAARVVYASARSTWLQNREADDDD